MKKPKEGLVFWLWADINAGFDWYLCAIQGDMLKFLTEDFEDYWNDDDWEIDEFKPCVKPRRKTQ